MHQRQYVGQWDKGTFFALSGVCAVDRQIVLYELLYILLIYILIIYIIIIISGSVLIGKSKYKCPFVPLSLCPHPHLTSSNSSLQGRQKLPSARARVT